MLNLLITALIAAQLTLVLIFIKKFTVYLIRERAEKNEQA